MTLPMVLALLAGAGLATTAIVATGGWLDIRAARRRKPPE